MSHRRKMWAVGVVVCAISAVWAQDSSTSPVGGQPDTGQPAAQEPIAAYGQQGSSSTTMSENPPLSGLDLPSLEPHSAPLSYLQPGATFSESADSNVTNALAPGSFTSITRALGTLTLHRLWSHYDLAVDYVGGVGYYDLSGQGWKNLQQMDLDQKITWRRGELSVRDSFSYLPEGNFGGAYGSIGSQGIQSLGGTGFSSFWGGTALGTLGVAPRILNVSLAEVDQMLTPKSTITATGGYGFTHFYGNDFSGVSFIGSSQVSAQVGYNRLISPQTQVAVVYGYQGFDFTVLDTAFHTHVVEGIYGHRITGRMDLLLGAGPQFTFIDTESAVCNPPSDPLFLCTQLGGTLGSTTVKNTKLGAVVQARLRYHFSRSSTSLMYEQFETSGSGLFAGAQANIVRFDYTKPLSRVWNAVFDLGYTHNVRTQPLTLAQVEQCTTSNFTQGACPANDANSYDFGFAGAGLHRVFGRSWHAFASYQFNQLAFGTSFCLTNEPCSRISNRQVVTVGLDWTPRPIRLD